MWVRSAHAVAIGLRLYTRHVAMPQPSMALQAPGAGLPSAAGVQAGSRPGVPRRGQSVGVQSSAEPPSCSSPGKNGDAARSWVTGEQTLIRTRVQGN